MLHECLKLVCDYGQVMFHRGPHGGLAMEIFAMNINQFMNELTPVV